MHVCIVTGDTSVRSKVADAPLRLWFDLSAIDALHCSGEFRRDCALDPLPTNRGELRRAIRKLHRRGLSYSDIAERLQKSFIPTATGVRTWRRSTIGQHLTHRVSGEDDPMPLGMSDELRLAFRAYAISQLLVAMCPFDPFAVVRYEIQQTQRDGLLVLETQAALPASIRRWIASAVVELHWFKGDQWGEVTNGGVPERAVPGTEEGRSAQLSSAGQAGEAQSGEGGASSPLHQPGSAHGPDDLPRPDGGR
jgi:hypothetical protein